MKFSIGVVIACFCCSFLGCLNDDSSSETPQHDATAITVSVVDSLGAPLSTTLVTWWFSSQSGDNVQFEAVCANMECSIWVIPDSVHGSILIKGVLDFQPQDDGCWADGSAVRSFEADSMISQSVDLVITDISITCM